MDDGLVYIGDELSSKILLEAYSFGIFPWPYEESPILWFSPNPRGVLDFGDFHVSRSLQKVIRQRHFEIRVNTAFDKVIESCAAIKRKGESGTWITEHMINNYKQFHRDGYAHSIECWQNEKLVGAVYGVYVAGIFSGESMFFTVDNASKVALVKLIEILKQKGCEWMDIQMVTDNLKKMGGKYISRKEFLQRVDLRKQEVENYLEPFSRSIIL